VTGVDDVRRWRVPGRVNLIGEHLDYNGGLALPIAIDRSLLAKVRRREDGLINVWSGGQHVSFPVDAAPGSVDGWAAYVAGSVWGLRSFDVPVAGADIVLETTLPVGAGLSSSAALTCAVAIALADLADANLTREVLAQIGAKAENDFVGAPTGLMDQYTVMLAKAGHALHLDFSTTPPTHRPISVDWTADSLVLAVIDTNVKHSLASGEYAVRRAECEAAAAEAGLEKLAQIGLDELLALPDELRPRARHVLTETARVKASITALARRDWTAFGTMLTASHESLRDDFAVSCPELDVAVEIALEAGALGARMTGGGFGGSVICLIAPQKVDGLRTQVEAAFAARSWSRPNVFTVRPCDGASQLTE